MKARPANEKSDFVFALLRAQQNYVTDKNCQEVKPAIQLLCVCLLYGGWSMCDMSLKEHLKFDHFTLFSLVASTANGEICHSSELIVDLHFELAIRAHDGGLMVQRIIKMMQNALIKLRTK